MTAPSPLVCTMAHTEDKLAEHKAYPLSPGALMLIEHKDRHEIKNTGDELLRTLNIYVPPSFKPNSDELPAGKS